MGKEAPDYQGQTIVRRCLVRVRLGVRMEANDEGIFVVNFHANDEAAATWITVEDLMVTGGDL